MLIGIGMAALRTPLSAQLSANYNDDIEAAFAASEMYSNVAASGGFLFAGSLPARARPRRLSTFRVFRSESMLSGAFVWVRAARNSPKRWLRARAVQHAARRRGVALPRRHRGLLRRGALWLGRIVALYHRSSTLCHICEHIRCLYL